MTTDKRVNSKVDELGAVADGLGLGIDDGIKRTVAVLNLLGVQTSGSCEGHLDHGLAFPWVDIETPEVTGWEENIAAQTQWYVANMRQASNILIWLCDFYSFRNTELGNRLCLEPIGIYGAVRLRAIGAEWSDEGTTRDNKQALNDKQAEMAAFTEFLEERL